MKIVMIGLLIFLASHCSPQALQTPSTTVVDTEEIVHAMPSRPDSEPILPGEDWVVPVSVGEMIEQPGICMSDAKAMRCAHFVVAYNELRSLYQTDIRTWNREREVYLRYLTDAEAENAYWRERSRRSWWEQHAAQVGLAAGIVVGAGLAVGLVYGLNQVVDE